MSAASTHRSEEEREKLPSTSIESFSLDIILMTRLLTVYCTCTSEAAYLLSSPETAESHREATRLNLVILAREAMIMCQRDNY